MEQIKKQNRELGAVFPGHKAVPGYHELSKRRMEQVSLIGIIETGKLLVLSPSVWRQ